jgi:shikimate dehydrogenase
MNKYALVGKNITHSKSPEIYRRLISPAIQYELLDYKESKEIPSAKNLLAEYNGINITSPYKKHFLGEVELTDTAREVGAINCLKKVGDKVIGENTDYLAIVDILKELQKEKAPLDIVVLGDGVMSRVVQLAIKNLALSPQVLSRKLTNEFSRINLNSYFQPKDVTPLIINTCAREYIFNGELPINAFFWDLNYNFPQHSQYLFHKVQKYFDGFDLLERQAFYAVAFWSNHENI